MIISILSIVGIYAAGVITLVALISRKRKSVSEGQVDLNISYARKEFADREAILIELAEITRGHADKEKVDAIDAEIQEVAELIQVEKGKLAITKAEQEAVDLRLRELEELNRELEVSAMSVVKELEMLRSQEKNIASKTASLKAELEQSADQLDMLLDVMSHSAAAVEQLNATKREIVNVEQQTSMMEQEIAEINEKYIGLKKAYDALDIEYAQLYERQQNQEGLL